MKDKYTLDQDCASLKVHLEQSNRKGKVRIDLLFVVDEIERVTIDHKAFTNECYYSNDKVFLEEFLKSGSTNLGKLVGKLQYSQVVIENSRNELKLLSSQSFFDTEPKEFRETNCMSDWLESKPVEEGRVSFSINNVTYDDLKVNPSDDHIRIYYVFKPDKGMLEKGMRGFIAKSQPFAI